MPTPVATVKLSELLCALEFASANAPFEHGAFIDRDTGAIRYLSSEIDVEEEIPDDLETSDRYIEIPHKNDLNLGRNLVLLFADETIPDEYETIAAFFRKKGAYARFKDFLEARQLLERWYSFEARETEKALRAWCSKNGVALANEPSAA